MAGAPGSQGARHLAGMGFRATNSAVFEALARGRHAGSLREFFGTAGA